MTKATAWLVCTACTEAAITAMPNIAISSVRTRVSAAAMSP